MVAHMPTRISLLWTVVLLTLPCPLFLVYCLAVVPPVAVLVLSANLIEQEGPLGLAAAALMISRSRCLAPAFQAKSGATSPLITTGASRAGPPRPITNT